MSELFFYGLDLSLSCPAVSICSSVNDFILTESYTTELKGYERIKYYLNKISEHFQKYPPSFIGIEGYSFMSKGNCLTNLAEFSGILKYSLFRKENKFIIMSPKTVKKFISNDGNAQKNKVMLYAYKNFKLEFKNDNECDAYVIGYISKYVFLKYNNLVDLKKLKIYQRDIIEKLILKLKEEDYAIN